MFRRASQVTFVKILYIKYHPTLFKRTLLNGYIVEILGKSDSYISEVYILLLSFSLICKAYTVKILVFCLS